MWLKILFFILVSIPIIIFTFYAVIVAALMGLIKFYVPLIIILAIGILFFICNGIFKFLPSSVLKWSFWLFTALCVVSVGTYEGIQAYHNSFITIDHEVNLYEYQPFDTRSKVVQLDEGSTFKMEGDLPILDGATALYPIYASFVEATYPEKEYDPYYSEVMVSRTPYAYENLMNGDVDMIFALGPSDRQLEEAKRKGIELKLTPIGIESFVFFVNSTNPVEGLTIQQIKDIYSGKIRNWSEVGGNNDKIRAFQRPDDSGSQTALEKLMDNTPIMEAPKEDVVAGMGGIIEQTANYRNYKNSIGYSFRFYSTEMVQNNEIQHLKINDVFPSKETIQSGEYPITYEFYAVTAGSQNPNIEPFLEWILSEQGQSIIEKTGYVPINETK